MKKEVTRVALVDDHELLRDGLTRIVNKFDGYKVILEAGNGKEFIELLENNESPDIILLDISMPVMDGYETAQWITRNLRKSRILVLSMLDHEIAIIRMLNAGARGYILKDSKPRILKEAFDYIRDHGYYCNDLVSNRLIIQKDSKAKQEVVPAFRITPKENEFLKFVCSDLTYVDIAGKMGTSPRTVDNYRDALYSKFDIKTRVGLAILAIKMGYYTV